MRVAKTIELDEHTERELRVLAKVVSQRMV